MTRHDVAREIGLARRRAQIAGQQTYQLDELAANLAVRHLPPATQDRFLIACGVPR